MRDPVTALDGRTWRVRRRWVPRLGGETVWGRVRRRIRATFRRFDDLPDPGVDGCAPDIGEGIVVILVILLLIFVGLPLLVALIDVVFVLLLALVGVIARVVLRHPWIVDAHADDGTVHTWRVHGFHAAGARRGEVEQLLRAGIAVPPDS